MVHVGFEHLHPAIGGDYRRNETQSCEGAPMYSRGDFTLYHLPTSARWELHAGTPPDCSHSTPLMVYNQLGLKDYGHPEEVLTANFTMETDGK